jgi:hypothetical protein
MKLNRLIMVFIAVVTIPIAAAAHDGHAHMVMGTVTSVDAKRLGVKTPSGEILAIAITQKTAVLRDKKKATLREVQVGRRVVVDIGNGEDPLVAREIQVGAAAKGSSAATAVH